MGYTGDFDDFTAPAVEDAHPHAVSRSAVVDPEDRWNDDWYDQFDDDSDTAGDVDLGWDGPSAGDERDPSDFDRPAAAVPAKKTSTAPKGRPSAIKWVAFEPVPGPPLARAVGLALGIMKHLKVESWQAVAALFSEKKTDSGDPYLAIMTAEDRIASLFAALVLSPEEHALLERYAAFFQFLRLTPTVTIAYCPSCFDVIEPADETDAAGRPVSPAQAHGWSVVSRTVPSKCKTTQGCEAKPVKVPAAVKSKTPPDPPIPDV